MDNQDPDTSHGWQLSNAQKFVEPLGATVVAEFFDVGQSRSVPWERREAAGRLLSELKNPQRGWDAVVVGEGTRCWFGNQFSLIAPRFAAYGVNLWIPELGGKFDTRNPSHKMLMSVLGGMSESERQHVQARVRAAMDAQVVNEGRHQGGRAPYGYLVVDGGPHPNPRKASEGYRLRKLAVDEPSVEVVRRIFAEYLDGRGDRAIANGLNRDAIPCPSARRPDQNRHRLADGWQGSTIRSILENPRYTDTHSSDDGPNTKRSSTPMTWQPGTSSDSGDPTPTGSSAPASPRIRPLSRWRSSLRSNYCGDHAPLVGWPPAGSWNGDRKQPSGLIRCGAGCAAGTAPGGWKEHHERAAPATGARPAAWYPAPQHCTATQRTSICPRLL